MASSDAAVVDRIVGTYGSPDAAVDALDDQDVLDPGTTDGTIR